MGALAERVRRKHPGAYGDLDDAELERRVVAKFPQYRDLVGTSAAEPLVPLVAPKPRARPSYTVKVRPGEPLPAGPPVAGEHLWEFVEQPLSKVGGGVIEEPETAGAVARNIPRVLAGLPTQIATLPITAPARVLSSRQRLAPGERPSALARLQGADEPGEVYISPAGLAEAAKEFVYTLPVPGVAEAVAAIEAPAGQRTEAALRQYARAGGLSVALPAGLKARALARARRPVAPAPARRPVAPAGPPPPPPGAPPSPRDCQWWP